MSEVMIKEKNRRKKRIRYVLLGLLLTGMLGFTGCSQNQNSAAYQDVDFAMGTTISQNYISGGSEEQAQEVLTVIQRLEQIISWRIEGSDVAKINEAAGTEQAVKVSEQAMEYLKACQEVYEKSGGNLDITVGAASRLWDIGGENPRVPGEEELMEALETIGGDRLLLGGTYEDSPKTIGEQETENTDFIDGETIDIPDDMEQEKSGKIDKEQFTDIEEGCYVTYTQTGGQLDLGAVGKGIACDEIASYIEETGLSEEINGTFSVGGSVLIYGSKDGADQKKNSDSNSTKGKENTKQEDPNGNPWKIGIRDPRGEEGSYMGSLTFSQSVGDKICVSTSGDYEKYFEEDGKRYHHILDPKTGAPAESDLISVTVIHESGFMTDALSTACFVAGKEEALKLAEIFGAEVILIDKNHKIAMTEGAEAYFTLLSKEYSLENEEK